MSNAPVFKANIGRVSVTVWARELTNQDSSNIVYNVEFSKSYKDQNGDWQNGNSFNHEDLLNLSQLTQRAEAFIAHTKQSN